MNFPQLQHQECSTDLRVVERDINLVGADHSERSDHPLHREIPYGCDGRVKFARGERPHRQVARLRREDPVGRDHLFRDLDRHSYIHLHFRNATERAGMGVHLLHSRHPTANLVPGVLYILR